MKATDDKHRIEVMRIFNRYGWVTNALAGKDASHNFWLLDQHQMPEIQRRLLPELENSRALVLANVAATSKSVQNANMGVTHTFSSAVLNEFHFGYVRQFSKRGPPPGVPDWQDLGMTINQQQSKTCSMIQQNSVSGFFSSALRYHRAQCSRRMSCCRSRFRSPGEARPHQKPALGVELDEEKVRTYKGGLSA